MVNAVRNPQKSLERHDRIYAYCTHTCAANVAKPSPGYKHATEDVKFSACTFSQILYTRQGTPRSSKYMVYVYRRHIRCTWDRRFLVGIVSLHSQRARQEARHSRYPNTYFFQTTPGNGLSFRYDWTVEIIRLFFSRTSMVLPAFL